MIQKTIIPAVIRMKFLVLDLERLLLACLHFSLQYCLLSSIGVPHAGQCLCFVRDGGSSRRNFDKRLTSAAGLFLGSQKVDKFFCGSFQKLLIGS